MRTLRLVPPNDEYKKVEGLHTGEPDASPEGEALWRLSELRPSSFIVTYQLGAHLAKVHFLVIIGRVLVRASP
jgi:hypothetical protein